MRDLTSTLDRLADASLLRRVLSESELVFKFRHTLDQQTAYHSLLRKDREMIHKVVGQVIERDPTEATALAPMLAKHFSVGGDDQRALKYYMLAGDEATRVYAHTEALTYYQSALGAAESLGVSGETIRELYLRRGRTLELSGDYEGAMDNYRRLESLGKSLNDVSLELAGLTRQTTLLVAPSAVSDPRAGVAMAKRLKGLAMEAGDKESEARARWSILLASLYDGNLEQAIAEGTKAQALARELGLEELEAFILNDISGPYMIRGQADRAKAALDRAIEIWRRLDNLPMLVDSLGNLNSFFIYAGDYERALQNSEQARAIADRIDNRWAQAFSLFLVEMIHAERGEIEKAISVCQEQIRLGREAGFRIPEVYSNAFQAWLLAFLGAYDRAFASLAPAAGAASHLGGMWADLPKCIEVFIRLGLGERGQADALVTDLEGTSNKLEAMMNSPVGPYWILAASENDLAQGRLESGLERLKAVVDRERKLNFHLLLVDVFELEARLYRALGDDPSAHDALDQAQAEAELVTSRRMAWVVHAERALWLEQDGEEARAASERAAAQSDFDYVVAHLGDSSLEMAFLGSERVKGLKMR